VNRKITIEKFPEIMYPYGVMIRGAWHPAPENSNLKKFKK